MFRLALKSVLVVTLLSTNTLAQQQDWPYRPAVMPTIPTVAEADWISNDIDAFIVQQLQQQGLKPAKRANRQTLVRRLYLDLIGLPPSPQEVSDFLADQSPQAYSQLVDKLLKDPRYGEHWARYWLDLARYADTAGYEGDPDLPHVWRYRDYVIDSFNRDKPYDKFIREQLAGDELQDILGAGELPNAPPEPLVAMTFLRLAPFTEPRGDESRHELLSEMTSTVSSVFLGLTVGCAKCHNHKYDPIPTEDFYRLKAFFATVQIPPPLRGDGFQIGGPTPAAFYRKGEADWAKKKETQLREQAASAAKELAALSSQLQEQLKLQAGFGIQTLGGSFGNDYFFDRRQVTDNKPHTTVITASKGRWQYYTDGRLSTDQGSLSGSNRGHWYNGLTKPSYLSLGAATNGTGKPELAFFNGRISQILVFNRVLTATEVKLATEKLKDLEGLRFWLDASDLDGDPDTANPQVGSVVAAWKDKKSGLVLKQDDAKLQAQLTTLPGTDRPAVQFDDDFLVGNSATAPFLADAKGSIVTVFSSQDDDESYIFEVGGNKQFVTTFVNPVAGGAAGQLEALIADRTDERISDQQRNQYRSLQARTKFLPQQLKRLQPLALTLRHSFGPPYEPGVPPSRVMIRGEWDNPGKVVQASFLSAITGHQEPAKIRLDPFKRWPTRSRRKALADWIASPKNPLTARVMVNRLWYRHFGRGIVKTPSDFGVLSDGPSHEQLLDYLALKLVKKKWSLKAVHRLICNSSTYQQSSRIINEKANKLDPQNVSLWRYPVRRLGAEVIRDRTLHVSGRLNGEHFGLPIFPPLPDDIEQRVKYDNSKWATQYDAEGRKRSIYIYQQRTLNMPLMQTFDAPVCDESRPRRRASTTPLQALAMYNGVLVTTEVPHFADRVIKMADKSPESRLQVAFKLALCREASGEEVSQLKQYYLAFEDPREAMISICRILYNSNEFLYLD
jgi:hypothetical protein